MLELKGVDSVSLWKWNFTVKGKGKMMFLSRYKSTERFSKAFEGFRITNTIDFKWNLCSYHFQRPCDPLSSQEEKQKGKSWQNITKRF